MSDEICGHIKNDGEPCPFSPKYPDGKCGHHTDHEDAGDTGRPTKLSYERQEKIATLIEQGESWNRACRENDVHPETARRWFKEGADEDNTPKAEFHSRLTRAKGTGEGWYTEAIKEIAIENGDIRLLMSMLKQRYPDSWGDTETGVDGMEITVNSEVVEVTESDIQH